MRRLLTGFAATAFGIAGAAFLALTFASSWNSERDGTVVPGFDSAVLAAGLVGAALASAGPSWWVLFDVPRNARRSLAAAFYSAQIGKYIPGGVWQVVGLVGLTKRAGVPTATAAVALPVHVVTQVAAAGAVGAFLAFSREVPTSLRGASAIGAVLVVLLYRGWMGRFLRWLDLRTGRGWGHRLPGQRAIISSFAWSATTIFVSGAAYAVLLRSLSEADGFGRATFAFSFAWLLGFLAVPFPSGLGVREAVLIATLGSGAAIVIASAIAQRLITMVGEAVFIVASQSMSRWRG